MRRDLLRAAERLALPTLALLVVVGLLPGRAGLAIWIYALLLAVAALVVLLAALRRRFPPATPLRERGARARQRVLPESLQSVENTVALGSASAFDFHHRLRPRLREVAEALLEQRQGVSLDGDPERARQALGDETWELVRADRPAPGDRRAPGVPLPALHRAVESLERV